MIVATLKNQLFLIGSSTRSGRPQYLDEASLLPAFLYGIRFFQNTTWRE